MSALTLRTRATLLATSIVGLTLLVAAVALVLTLQAQLSASSDALARSRVSDVLALAAADELPNILRNIDAEGVAQVVGMDGQVLASSPNIAGRTAIADLRPDSGFEVRTVDAPDDGETERYRLWAGSGSTSRGPVTVYVGTSLESAREASTTLRRSLVFGLPGVLLLLGLAIWVVFGAALRRVDRLRGQVDAITEDDLDQRLEAPHVDDEVGRLSVTMNRMLDRLQGAQQRQLRFVADVSHDLQSPLTAQRAQLEVALTHPQDVDVTVLGRDLLASTNDMEHLVRDLLFLAAADAGGTSAPDGLLDLDDIVLEEAARARPGSTVRVDTYAVSAAPVTGNRSDLQRLVRNLVDNAVDHAASRVELRLSTVSGTAVLEVGDDGPGIAPLDRERVFERFYRGDAARARQGGGTGLGLAIARTLVGRMDGTIDLAPVAGPRTSGAHFVVRIPCGAQR